MSISYQPFDSSMSCVGSSAPAVARLRASLWTRTSVAKTSSCTSTCRCPCRLHRRQGREQVLSISAERHFEQKEGDEFLVTERPQGRFSRQLRLGTTIDTDNIAASYDDGVLTLTLPVSERARPRQLQVGRDGGRPISEG
jgi:hypothetical protein